MKVRVFFDDAEDVVELELAAAPREGEAIGYNSEHYVVKRVAHRPDQPVKLDVWAKQERFDFWID